MTTNYFDNLPISTELQLALSALVAPASSGGEAAEVPYVLVSPGSEPESESVPAWMDTPYHLLSTTRVGNGPGASAGDSVTALWLCAFTSTDVSEVLNLQIPAPYLIDTELPSTGHVSLDFGSGEFSAGVEPGPDHYLNLSIPAGLAAGYYQASITIHYHTALAVDPA